MRIAPSLDYELDLESSPNEEKTLQRQPFKRYEYTPFNPSISSIKTVKPKTMSSSLAESKKIAKQMVQNYYKLAQKKEELRDEEFISALESAKSVRDAQTTVRLKYIDNRAKDIDKDVGALIYLLETTKLSKIEEENQRVAAERKRQEEERKIKEEAERKRKEEEMKKKKEEEERKIKEEIEKKRKDEEAKAAREKLAQEEKKSKEAMLAAENSRKEQEAKMAAAERKNSPHQALLEAQKICLDYRKNVKEVIAKNSQLKMSCMKLKMKLKPRFGQLTNSKSKLAEIFADVYQTIKSIQSGDPLIVKWVMHLVSKMVIDQAQSEVSCSIKAGQPLARLCVYLMIMFPELQVIMLAKIHKKCPYTLGYVCAQDTVEGRLRMGWKYQDKEAKKFEDDLKYTERTGGIYTVWAMAATVLIDEVPGAYKILSTAQNPQNPISLGDVWTATAKIINSSSEFMNNSVFHQLCIMMESTGEMFLVAYGSQGTKFLLALCQFATQFKLPNATKLVVIGEKWQKTGKIGNIPKMEG